MRPQIGERIAIRGELYEIIEEGIVEAIFDDLNQDWGMYGELAWAASESDLAGEANYWLIVSNPDDRGESFVICDAEVDES
jgi:hypothetical protein